MTAGRLTGVGLRARSGFPARKQVSDPTVFAGQAVGIKEVHDDIWLVSFMDYDLGYFDLETRVLEPLENPFGPITHVSGLDQEKVARPGRLELPTLCLEAVRSTLPNLARGVANRADSASWGKFPQPAFSFLCCRLPPFCRYFPQLALHFRDSRHYQPNTVEDVCLLGSATRIAARLRFPSTSTECNRVKSRQIHIR